MLIIKAFLLLHCISSSLLDIQKNSFFDFLSPANSNSFFIGPQFLGKKGSYDFTTVSVSVGKHVFSITVHWIFLKFVMKLGWLKGEKQTEPHFWKKNLILGTMLQNTAKIGFLRFFKTNNPLMCWFFWIKGCSVMTFMILFKLHVWENSGFRVKCKNPLSNHVQYF